MKKISLYLKIACAFLALFAVASCSDNSPKGANSAKAEKVAKVKKNKKKAKKAEAEAPKPAQADIQDSPVQDSHFLSVYLPTRKVKAGEFVTAEVELSVPFTNPFDPTDVYVEASVNGIKNGVSATSVLWFVKGDAEKSLWKMAYRVPKTGKYTVVFSVKAEKKVYSSLDEKFSAADKVESTLFRVRGFSRFKNAAGAEMRAIGADIGTSFADGGAGLLKRLASAGANTVKIDLHAPNSIITENGWVNMPLAEAVENFVDEAFKNGIYTVVNFASAADFEDAAFAKTPFGTKDKKEFFTSFEIQTKYNAAVAYMARRLSAKDGVLAWSLMDGADKVAADALDACAAWLTSTKQALGEIDRRNVIVQASTSSDLDFFWSADVCDIIAFDLSGSRDFASAAAWHARAFSKKYKKPVAFLDIGRAGDVLNYPEPSGTAFADGLAGAMFSNSPMALVDFRANEKAALSAISRAAKMESKFGLAKYNLFVRNMPFAVMNKARKIQENSFIVQPAFSTAIVSRETSNDLAVMEINASEPDVENNTMTSNLVAGGVYTFVVKAVPQDKSTFSFRVVSAPVGAEFSLDVSRNDEHLLSEKVSTKDMKPVVAGSSEALVDRVVKIPVDKGDTKITVVLTGEGARASIADVKIDKAGSSNGFASADVFCVANKGDTVRALFFKRSGTDTYSFGKYKLYTRESLPPVKSVEYPVEFREFPNTDFKVVWWDLSSGRELASGVSKTGKNGVLKLRTMPFSAEAACVIEKAL